jgi:putative oxidoreductase
MKRIFSTNYSSSTLNIWLLIFRVAAGCFMLTHGLPKLAKLMGGGEIQFADPFGLGTGPSLWLAVFAEAICSFLLILGLATRLATIPLIITMSVAAFIAHANDPFGKKELALVYLLIFITIAILGPGKYSLDALINRPQRR